jgi:polyphosphate kinase
MTEQIQHSQRQPLPPLSPETFINRELSNIEFQKRILAMARDEDQPLLERMKFLAIVGSNLDEFFMVRVASYIQKINFGITRARPDGYTPSQLVEQIRGDVDALFKEQRRIKRYLTKELAEEGIHFISYKDLAPDERETMRQYFMHTVFPVLTPLAADHARPFPFISNLSLNLGVYVRRRDTDEDIEFARLKVPVEDILPRIVKVNQLTGDDDHDKRLMYIEELIIHNLDALFPGMEIIEAYPFRVLRNADIDYEQENDEDLRDVMSIIEQGVRERRFGSVVRLSVPKNISQRMLKRLREGLELPPQAYIYQLETSLGTANLFELLSLNHPDLKDEPYVPKFHAALPPHSNIFEVLRQQDIILHHPYDSFTPVEEFFRTAATDPQVLAIKATLYRVGKNSPIVQALMDARDNEKQVTVLVELKARFDEENNLLWARTMEEKGVHVMYGVEEIAVKTHAKIALVVRRDEDGVHRYLHLGTGNYNSSTARLYTDMGLMTANPVLGEDASRLFNRLTGYAPTTTYDKFLVAPDYLFDHLYHLIENEIQAARNGREARLIFKMNQLEEDRMIQKLYEASQAGVQVDLLVRGLCCLRPGVPGVSENIRVISIIGRYLEHSRAYYFKNAPEAQQLYLGSADLMRRNLYNRVEVVFPILEGRIRMKVLRMLATQLLDNVGAWDLQSDGSYVRREPQSGETVVNSQELLMRNSFGLDLLP